jgi:beta-phosphoglucomutase-like phosphatase (HAD superfamily)
VSVGVALDVDRLVAVWWEALAAAERALALSPSLLDPHDVAEGRIRLADERTAVLTSLRTLSRDLHRHSLLVRCMESAALGSRLLGLPADVRACVFDLDGVLTSSALAHRAAWADALDDFLLERAHRHGRQYLPFDRQHDYEEHMAGKPRLDGVRAFLASRGFDLPAGSPSDPPGAETVYGLANRKRVALDAYLAHEGVHAFAGAHSYLEAARILGLRRVVVSASASTQAILERAGLVALVEGRIDAQAMAEARLRPRPAADVVLAACRAVGVAPSSAASFETTPAGVAAARAAGVRYAVGVGGDADAVRGSDADVVVTDLAELIEQALRGH